MGRRTGRRKHRPKSAKEVFLTTAQKHHTKKKEAPAMRAPLKLLRGETRRARLRQQHQQGKA